MLARLILALCMLAGGLAHAQTPPLIKAHINNRELPVRVQSAAVETVISGGMAETAVKLVFHNPNARQLEGELQFPLAEGEQITGFALDIDGEMRPAVPVGKERGRQILEAEERRRIDPALLEQTHGNNFKLRIYPIPGKGTRTVELKYAAMLPRQQKNWSYRLPLKHFTVPVALDELVQVAADAHVAVAGASLGGRGQRGICQHFLELHFHGLYQLVGRNGAAKWHHHGSHCTAAHVEECTSFHSLSRVIVFT